MNKLSFDNAKDFISWVEKQRRFSPKVSIDKMMFYLGLFDNPHKKFESIHVTGTNGKGSVVAFIKTTLIEAGFNIATFTSPYITKFNERICYNNEMISDEELLEIANQILSKYDLIEKSEHELPTFFEFITLLAFIYYSKLPDLDLAIIEVGMGGRLDSTNVITPLLSIITNISLEHTKILGDTLEKIANEKLGIVKENSCLVVGKIDKTLNEQFENYCKNKNSKLIYSLLEEFEIKKQDIYSSEFILGGQNYKISLTGSHQIENAICAIRALDVLKNKDKKWKNSLNYEIYYRGLSKTKWQGRMEILNENPLIIVDGCHNIDGIKRICNFIKNLKFGYKRAIVSISEDKDLQEMIDIIDDTFDEIVFTNYTYQRSASANQLYELSHHTNKILLKNVSDSLKYCYDNKCDYSIFMGSLYLVSEVRNIIKPQ